MAVTKIHPIKSTLKKALDYICDPEKTDEKLLISSFGCAPETADIEFDFTRRLAKNKSTIVLARHLIQSFEPGEVTPEQAHEIGKQFADEVLGGKYEYVLTTHIDKGHVHNHIIFNNVDVLEHKRYDSNKQTYHRLRRISDRLCKENGLSVIKNPVAKNIGRKEYEERKKGGSWKARLQNTIDVNIEIAQSFDDFINLMKKDGYEIKRGKHIAFRAPGQERFTRAKTLGEDYTEDRIRDRIQEKFRKQGRNSTKDNDGTQSRSTVPKRNTIYRPNVLHINLLINIKAHAIARNRALDRWMKVRNLKEAANTLNFLSAQNISSTMQLHERVAQLKSELNVTGDTLKLSESKLRDLSEIISDLTKYQKLIPIADQYNRAFNKKKFREAHESELIIFETAERILTEKGIDLHTDVERLKTDYQNLTERKDALYQKYCELRVQINNFDKAQENIKQILKTPQHTKKVEKTRG